MWGHGLAIPAKSGSRRGRIGPCAFEPEGGLQVTSILRDQEGLPSGSTRSVLEPGSVSVVIPAKNEAANIAWVLKRIPPTVDEIVLVDGHSVDDTVEVARRQRPDIVVVQEERRGKGAALQAGFAAATGDIVVMLDADGSMHPAEISRYVALLSSGFDFVKGSRFMAGGGSTDITTLRRLGNRGLLALTNLIYGTRFTDLCYGYCAFRRAALGSLQLSASGFEIETQLIVHATMAGLRISEVPSVESPRRFGQSNLRTFRDGRRVLWTLLRERSAFRRSSSRPDVIDLTDHTSARDSVALQGVDR
jgi:glycosyltransferase involved in cell wall biosynthesis